MLYEIHKITFFEPHHCYICLKIIKQDEEYIIVINNSHTLTGRGVVCSDLCKDMWILQDL